MSKSRKQKTQQPAIRNGGAKPHGALKNDKVHVFVDDQNLFWGVINSEYGAGFRIDFGRLLTVACRDTQGNPRFVKSAFISGVIPDDDSFWQIAKNQGFTVRRGYLTSGSRQRSKQDDAFLITEITSTLYEQEGPSTIVLVAGDADYGPPLMRALEKGWRTEMAFIDRGRAGALENVVHQFRTIYASSLQYIPNFP